MFSPGQGPGTSQALDSMVGEAGLEMRIGTCGAPRERSVPVSGGPGTPAQAGSGRSSEDQDWKEAEEQEHGDHQGTDQGGSRGRDHLCS